MASRICHLGHCDYMPIFARYVANLSAIVEAGCHHSNHELFLHRHQSRTIQESRKCKEKSWSQLCDCICLLCQFLSRRHHTLLKVPKPGAAYQESDS